MLVTLKKQRLQPTLLLALLYLFISHAFAILFFVGFESVLFWMKMLNMLTTSDAFIFALLSLAVLISSILTFILLKFIHDSFFKSYPVTPLFLISLAFLSSALVCVHLVMMM